MAGKDSAAIGWDAWWRVARRPAMLVALAALLVAATACGLLGRWQLGRAEQQALTAETQRIAAANHSGPVPMSDVLAPQRSLTAAAVGRLVEATGSFDAAGQLLVPDRMVNGRTGWLVLAPLRTEEGAWLPVVRGWVAETADAPPPPVGAQRVVGWIAPSEAAASQEVGAGQIATISSAELAGVWGTPIYPGYLVAQETDATASALLALPEPVSQPAGWRLQNLFYALEWWVFGAFALVLWWRLVRDRARQASAASAGVVSASAAPQGEAH